VSSGLSPFALKVGHFACVAKAGPPHVTMAIRPIAAIRINCILSCTDWGMLANYDVAAKA